MIFTSLLVIANDNDNKDNIDNNDNIFSNIQRLYYEENADI